MTKSGLNHFGFRSKLRKFWLEKLPRESFFIKFAV